MAEVKLLGTWPSPFVCRVVWALKIKGISYEFKEEDLSNKSPLLLKYNPVHKKVPVLVHDGKPVCESMVIVEYIEETWPQNPLLPVDPHDRALARFWVKFAEDKGSAIWKMFFSTGEEQEKATKESLDMLQNIEEHVLWEKKFCGGDEIGIVDIAFGSITYWLGVIEDIIGIKLLEADKFPHLYAWAKTFEEAPIIKENLPNRDGMLNFFKGYREKLLASTGQ